jgi:hypothetical protein
MVALIIIAGEKLGSSILTGRVTGEIVPTTFEA